MLIRLLQRQKRSWSGSRVNQTEVERQEKARELPMIMHKNRRMGLRSHTITQKEEGVPKEDKVVEEVLLEEEEEA
jgi:hypothetical protein